MQKYNIEITLSSLLYCILLIIIIITIVSYYNYSINNQFSTLYIQAQPESNNKDSDNNKEEEELDDKEDKKEKDEQEEKLKIKKKDDDDKDSWTKADKDLITKYNYRNLAIPKVYQTAPVGEIYKFKQENPNGKVQVDEEKNKNIFTKQNKDGSWRIDYGRPRIDIYTKDAGILSDKQILQENLSKSGIQSWNYSELKDIGYWYKPTDWKNVEFTLIFKLLDSSRSKGEQHAISLVTRSISHSEKYDDDDEPPFYCGGSSYHNNISNEGNLRMKKEQYHVNYEWERYADTLTVGNIYDKIIGFKGIVYNINDTAVKIESWVDLENGGKGSYKQVHEFIDNGNWGDAMTECRAKSDGQAITWGSPVVIIKANDFKFDIYDIEVREIISPYTDK